jgi:hypothetical protein
MRISKIFKIILLNRKANSWFSADCATKPLFAQKFMSQVFLKYLEARPIHPLNINILFKAITVIKEQNYVIHLVITTDDIYTKFERLLLLIFFFLKSSKI